MSVSNFLNINTHPAYAKQDKIKIKIGTWDVHTADHLMQEFLHTMGQTSRHNHINCFSIVPNYNPIAYLPTFKSFDILTSNNNPLFPPPLFSGQLVVETVQENRFELRLQLYINPTRFCAYQLRPVGGLNGPSLQGDPLLFSTGDLNRYRDEFSLDRNDNVLLTNAAKVNGSHGLYSQNLRRYFDAIIRYMSNELTYWHQVCGVSFSFGHREYFSLQSIEHYWELRDDESLLTVRSLVEKCSALSNHYLIHEYRNTYIENEDSAFSIRCNFRAGEQLKIYAKTNKRIRLEVSYNHQESSYLAGGSYTNRSIGELVSLIERSQATASALAIAFIRALRRQVTYPEVLESTGINFVTQFYRTVNDITLAENLLTRLITLNGIPRGGLGQPEKNALGRLVRKNLVLYNGRPVARYTIAPHFAHIMNRLLATQRHGQD